MFKTIKKQVYLIFLMSMTIFFDTSGFEYNGRKFNKNNMPIYYVNFAGTPDCSNEFQAIQNALNTWNAVLTTYANFQYGGTTSNNNVSEYDGTNLLIWVENNWNSYFPGNTAIAVNSQFFYTATPEVIIETDISFNGTYLWSDNGSSGKYDVQNIATHELGHSISLGDLYGSGDTEKTMYGYSGTGETKKRTLHSDDIYGIRYVLFEAQTSGTLSENQVWVANLGGNINLSGDLSIPSGKSLTLKSGSTVNLNGYSIISTGGTIVKKSGSTITGLKAYLKSGSTIKGYCSSITSACTNAANGNIVEIISGSITEDVSFSGKSNLTIKGQGISQTRVLGKLNISNSSNIVLEKFRTRAVKFNNCTNSIVDVDIWGDGSDAALNCYNSSVVVEKNREIGAGSCGILATIGTVSLESDYYNKASIFSCGNAIVAGYHGSVIVDNFAEICQSDSYDAFVSNLGSITIYNGLYTNANARTRNDGGTINIINEHYCSSAQKPVMASVINNEPIKTKEKDYIGLYNKMNKLYKDLFKKIHNEKKRSGFFDKSIFYEEYNNVIKEMKMFLKNYADEDISKTLLTTLVHCYYRFEEYEEINDYLSSVIADKKYANLSKLAKRFTMDYYMYKKDFINSLSIADEILAKTDVLDIFSSDVLYSKGLIYAKELNEPQKAVDCFNQIVNTSSKENNLTLLAIDELDLLC